MYPPPATASGFFELFAKNTLLGLISTDLLYTVTNMLMILIYVPLYLILKKTNASLSLLALILSVTGVAAYFSSVPAFEMLTLSGRYASATEPANQAMFLAAGETMLAQYTGTAYNAYYVLNAAALLIFAYLMIKGGAFGKTGSIAALLAGFFMIIPASAGKLGLIFSFLSLIPYAVWLVIAAKVFFKQSAGK
ncbi:MAG TPA: DUF4386 family protein, partial [Candidatus Goldiibacteriota bacterium]|nr:DUF4386 family protein [Candidatus Goldiibacteriota bacterium]